MDLTDLSDGQALQALLPKGNSILMTVAKGVVQIAVIDKTGLRRTEVPLEQLWKD